MRRDCYFKENLLWNFHIDETTIFIHRRRLIVDGKLRDKIDKIDILLEIW